MRETRVAARAVALTAALTAAVGVSVATPRALRAQEDVAEMAAECAGPLLPGALGSACTDGALALAAARAGVGLAMAHGSAVPGSASTLGRRMASSPRLAFSLRAGTAHAPFADPGTGAGAPDEGSFWPSSLEGAVTVGLLEGWSLAPTVGGFLSLDLLASVGLVSLPGSKGFDGSIQDIGYGARVGIFRESFTLPGVSASLVRRHGSEVEWGRATGDGAHATFKPVASSLRLTVAKDLIALGVLGGLGWDWYGGDAALTVRRSLPAGVGGEAASDELHTDRQLVFAGLSYTLLVLQLSVEGGWAGGFSGPTGSGGWDPDAGSFFGSVAARLTY